MKTKTFVYLMSLCLLTVGCGKGDQINANSDNSLYRSVIALQRRLPDQERVEFEVSFWSLKQFAQNESTFRNQVNGKTVQEVIEMGKQNFAAQKAAGNADYIKYPSWEAMIAELVKERQQSAKRVDRRDRANRIQGL